MLCHCPERAFSSVKHIVTAQSKTGEPAVSFQFIFTGGAEAVEELQLSIARNSSRRKVHSKPPKPPDWGKQQKETCSAPPPHQGVCKERNLCEMGRPRRVDSTGCLAFDSSCSKAAPKPQPAGEEGSAPMGCAVSIPYPCQFLLGEERCTDFRERTKFSLARWETQLVLGSHPHHSGVLLDYTEGSSSHSVSL